VRNTPGKPLRSDLVTTQSQLYPQRSKTLPLGEREGEAANPGPRAEPGGIHADTHARAAAGSANPASSLDPATAEEFAASFRPSWAPLTASEDAPAARASRAPAAPAEPAFTAVPSAEDVEPAPLRTGRLKRRALGLIAVSVASFALLTYWGVTSATRTPTGDATVAATKALRPRDLPLPARAAKPEVERPRAAAAAPAPAAIASPGATEQPTAADTTQPAAETAQPTAAESPPPSGAIPGQPPAAEAAPPASETAQQPATAAPSDLSRLAAAPGVQAPTAESSPAESTRAAPTAPPEPSPPEPGSPSPPDPAETRAAAAQPAHEPTGAIEPAVAHAPPAPASVRPAPNALAAEPSAPQLAAAAATPAPSDAVRPKNPLLSVRALPENSKLWLDGQRMSNPFDVRLPRGYKHRIDARADGYEATSQMVRIESDARLTLTLRRAGPGTAAAQGDNRRRRGGGFVSESPY
jgi:hypothetical protein